MPNRRLLCLWLLAGFTLAGGLAWWLGLLHHPGRGLAYQGKPLTYWFNQLPMTRTERIQGTERVVQSSRKRAQHIKSGALQYYGTWVEEPEASTKAIHRIGTNGLAFYFARLTRQERHLEKKIQQAAFAVGLRRFLYEDAEAEREQAVTALLLLKPLPESTVRELVTLSTNANASIANAARCVLTADPNKLAVTPPLDLDELFRSQIKDRGRWQLRFPGRTMHRRSSLSASISLAA